jgi:hypothetical protein
MSTKTYINLKMWSNRGKSNITECSNILQQKWFSLELISLQKCHHTAVLIVSHLAV